MTLQTIKTAGLRPFWGNTDNHLTAHARWIVTPVGGPEGFLHMNRNDPGTVTTESCTAGLIVLPPGVSSPGLHVHHDFDEIYILVKGQAAAVGPEGEDHPLSYLDFAWIPRDTPHGLRNTGFEDAHVLYFQTGVERDGFQTGRTDNLGGSTWIRPEETA